MGVYDGYLEKVADEFAAYTEELYKAYPGGAAAAGFVSKEAFVALHTAPVKTGWAGYQATKEAAFAQKYGYGKPAMSTTATREDIEAASPFIRLVLERMLDLLDSEASWTKGKLAADADDSQVNDVNDAERWCILGAMTKAEKDLLLDTQGGDHALDEARQKVVTAIRSFFDEAMRQDHGMGIPSWNDATGTDYEDVRLWLKSLFDRIP